MFPRKSRHRHPPRCHRRPRRHQHRARGGDEGRDELSGEIFEATGDLVANWEKYAKIVSHTIPFDDVTQALASLGQGEVHGQTNFGFMPW
jgi:hypothetical protein